jgi:putative oxidoreductase
MTTHPSRTVAPRTSAGRRGRAATIAVWALQAVTAAAIFAAGMSALLGAALPVAIFDAIGAGDWFRYLTGALQVAGAIGLLVPRLAGPASLALVGMWLGALAVHLLVIGGDAVPAVVLLVLSAAVAWARRRETVALAGALAGTGARS